MDESLPFRSLRRMARSATRDAEEECDLCGERIPAEHRHLLDIPSRQVLCACRGCTILFDRSGSGHGERRLIPNRYRYLEHVAMTDAQWESLRVPVNMAFFSYSTPAGRVVALYPGPMGPTESQLSLDTWEDLERATPLLREMEPDVEAFLVNRTRGRRESFLVPIDECFKLVGVIRVNWKGLTGGQEVWTEIDRFFALLKTRGGTKGTANA